MSGKTPEMIEAEADKNLTAIFRKQSKAEEAAELYQKAGNMYKINRQFQEAGRVFEKSAGALEKANGAPFEIAAAFIEAAKVYKASSYQDYMRCEERAINIYIADGKIKRAAPHLKTAAEAAEGNSDYDTAISHYQRAMEFFEIDDVKSTAQQCKLALANIQSLHKKDYKKAATLYEELARTYMDNNLTKFSAKDCFFRAAICRLAGLEDSDTEAVKEKFSEYATIDPTLNESFEQRLIMNICDAIANGDEEKYSDHVAEYDNLHRLDPWKVQMLLRVKETMQGDSSIL
ncbi:putative Alpha-soluble NSF attachment protein [Blattamonas nauphoetae]|uniref:Alpha-soluble NSF attachment protein n=1 Tax=Blattamonas nauphoetae TaxID=2049346 RepID=A0ABQ9XT99_9EUKA|nr:putative Alpha-soluble NSF attachment protein [Blattamonas nauphoetae]